MSEPKRTWRDSIEIPRGGEWVDALDWLLCAGLVLVAGVSLAVTVFRQLLEDERWSLLAICVGLFAVVISMIARDFYRHRLELISVSLLAIWFGATAIVWLGVL